MLSAVWMFLLGAAVCCHGERQHLQAHCKLCQPHGWEPSLQHGAIARGYSKTRVRYFQFGIFHLFHFETTFPFL